MVHPSFPDFVREHVHVIGRGLRAYGVCEADLDDGVQQVVCVLARRLGDIVPGSERAFIFQVARRVADHLRRQRARRREVPIDELEPTGHPTAPDALLEQNRAIAVVGAIVSAMPEELREVFVLSDLEQLSKSEVAHALSLAEGTVASRLRRARESFRREFARRQLVRRGEVA